MESSYLLLKKINGNLHAHIWEESFHFWNPMTHFYARLSVKKKKTLFWSWYIIIVSRKESVYFLPFLACRDDWLHGNSTILFPKVKINWIYARTSFKYSPCISTSRSLLKEDRMEKSKCFQILVFSIWKLNNQPSHCTCWVLSLFGDLIRKTPEWLRLRFLFWT